MSPQGDPRQARPEVGSLDLLPGHPSPSQETETGQEHRSTAILRGGLCHYVCAFFVKLNVLKTLPLKHHYITNLFHAIVHNNPEEANITLLKGYSILLWSRPSLPLNLIFQSPNSSGPRIS